MTKKEAIDHCGGVPALAKALGITPHAVYMWNGAKPIPERHALRLTYEIPRVVVQPQQKAA